MRTAPDGKRYTKREFQQFFGGFNEWDARTRTRPGRPPAGVVEAVEAAAEGAEAFVGGVGERGVPVAYIP